MSMSDCIALGSLIISVTAFIISILYSTKKYELSSAHRKELLDWFNKTVEVLIVLRLNTECNNDYDKINDMAKLSSLIECGRFYFPNVDKGDGFGREKPSAYAGYREIALELLVYSYNIFQKDVAKKGLFQKLCKPLSSS